MRKRAIGISSATTRRSSLWAIRSSFPISSTRRSAIRKTNLRSPTAMWDFWSLSPESLHQVTILFSDRPGSGGVSLTASTAGALPAADAPTSGARGPRRVGSCRKDDPRMPDVADARSDERPLLWSRLDARRAGCCRCPSSSSGRRRCIAASSIRAKCRSRPCCSIKTGGCPEDCGYCPQSAHYDTGVDGHDADEPRGGARGGARRRRRPGATPFLHGRGLARAAMDHDSTRSATWSRACSALGMESCVTLGMLTDDQARRLAEAGLTATTTTSTRRAATTATSSRRAPTTIGSNARRSAATPASSSAAAASSAWARRGRTAIGCSRCWPTCRSTRKACRSTAGADRRHAAGAARAGRSARFRTRDRRGAHRLSGVGACGSRPGGRR